MKALGMSFVYAIRGIFYCLHHERNMRIHFVCMAYMYFFLLGFDFFQLSRTQFAIIFLANAAVIMGELINTAVERTVDLHSKGKHPLAKAAKDSGGNWGCGGRCRPIVAAARFPRTVSILCLSSRFPCAVRR